MQICISWSKAKILKNEKKRKKALNIKNFSFGFFIVFEILI